MTAFSRTVLAVFLIAIITGVVETVAYTSGFRIFVPITWTIIEGSIAAPLVTFALGMLLGHFSLPRFSGWQRWAAIACNALGAAFLFSVYLPGSAGQAGIVAGALFFVAEDRRRTHPS